MNLTLHHRDVGMNLVIASVIARKLYKLEKTLGVTDATVTLQMTHEGWFSIGVRADLGANGSSLEAEGTDAQPGTALIKLMADLQKGTRRRLKSQRRNGSPRSTPSGCAVTAPRRSNFQKTNLKLSKKLK
jgi:ribosome-associated translation inhibitor RaiA